MDRAVLWLSAGTLTLSVNYIIGLHNNIILFPCALVWSWIFLMITVLTHMIAFYISKKYHQKTLKELNKWSKSGFTNTNFEISENTLKYGNWANHVGNIAFSCLVVGLILMTIFAIHNIPS